MDYETFLELHEPQLLISGVPQHVWPGLLEKLNGEGSRFGNKEGKMTFAYRFELARCQGRIKQSPTARKVFDAGDFFAMIQEESPVDQQDQKSVSGCKWQIQATSNISASHTDAVFLIDHAWTFRCSNARSQLMDNPNLLKRMCDLIGTEYEISGTEESNGDEKMKEDYEQTETATVTEKEQVDAVLTEIWKYAQTYSVRAPGLKTEHQMPVWYVMDEFGCRIQHSDDSNVRILPFYFAGTQMFYSVMFLIKDIHDGDEVTRDYVEISEFRKPEWRELYLLPWFYADYSQLPLENIVQSDDFFMANREVEIMPETNGAGPERKAGKLKIYADDDALVKHLKDSDFELVHNEQEADVLWLRKHFKNYKLLAEDHPNTMVNQFPNESVVTVKDLLAAAVQNSYRIKTEGGSKKEILEDKRPFWFPVTYNLRTELPEFVSLFQNRAKQNLDNHWIVKPWNLARGLDTYVTSGLPQIIRLIDSGPKIACKYLEDPVCFFRDDIEGWVKFDLRFIVLLKSVQPLDLFVYDRFWLRFALKPFSLGECDDYEKHFTVFNYLDESKILQMECEDFVEKFEDQNPGIGWQEVQKNLYATIKELFQIATREKPPKGIGHCSQSRAMYGVDMMLRWRTARHSGEKVMQPVMLEVNFMPDCERACDYYPGFADTVFKTLFATDSDNTVQEFVTKL